jgi:3-oxoacyl-[acyl-carrier protein] reductase
VYNTNVKSVFYTLRAAANNIEANGRIIVLGSRLKKGVTPNMGVYASSKAAVEVLANTAAQELGGKGVTVNTIHPGPVDTGNVAHYFINYFPILTRVCLSNQ